jgi:putative SOS response-associated peptidase YedK
LVQAWSKDHEVGDQVVTARAEALTERPGSAKDFEQRHCLVPADSFNEWDRDSRTTQPMVVAMATCEPFAFTGPCLMFQELEGFAERAYEASKKAGLIE